MREKEKERSRERRGQEKKDAFLTHALCVGPGGRLLHGCAMISERSGDPFVLPDENKCDRAHSFGSDKSANNADGNYVAVVQEKIYILIYRKKINFSSLGARYKTIDRGVSHLKHLSISIMIKYFMFHHNLFIIHHNLLCTHTFT